MVRTKAMKLLARSMGIVAGIAVLAFILYLYGRPDFLMVMVNQLWSCF
jgi:hypothetical protein